MREYDVIIGFGLGPIFAFSIEIPFIHYPYGADLTVFPFEKSHIASFQRTALRHAKYVIVGDPDYFDYLKKLGIEARGEFIPYMIDTDVYEPLPRNQAMGSLEPDLRDRVHNRFVFFVPSRQDFYWKGSDKMLMAFARLVQKRGDVFMILSGWGNDLDKSKEMIDRLDLRRHTFFLPHVLSKKKLRSFYGVADVVIDQFNVGGYGTSTMEAMACGKPVIIDLQMGRYAPYLKEIPPVVRAKSDEEIYSAMLKLSGNKRDICRQIGKKSREWIMEFHGTKNNLEKMIGLCQQSVTKSR
jgi:glycosyltransferase involved in cell wall biosynthesis